MAKAPGMANEEREKYVLLILFIERSNADILTTIIRSGCLYHPLLNYNYNLNFF